MAIVFLAVCPPPVAMAIYLLCAIASGVFIGAVGIGGACLSLGFELRAQLIEGFFVICIPRSSVRSDLRVLWPLSL